jgi:hypothetical protein
VHVVMAEDIGERGAKLMAVRMLMTQRGQMGPHLARTPPSNWWQAALEKVKGDKSKPTFRDIDKHSRNNQETFRDHSGNIQGLFMEHSGKSLQVILSIPTPNGFVFRSPVSYQIVTYQFLTTPKKIL